VLEWGVEDTQTVSVPFTIPAGVPLTGVLQATGPSDDADEGEDFEEDEFFTDEGGISGDRRTVAQAVDDILATPKNNTLLVTYRPLDMSSELDEDVETYKTYNSVTATTVSTG
jgi:hypothetical protein